MGTVSNCTPVFDQAFHNKVKYQETMQVKSKHRGTHRTQQPSQASNQDKCKQTRCRVKLQRHPMSGTSVQDDVCDAETKLESFSDSNGEQCSTKYKMSDHTIPNHQYSEKISAWDRSYDIDTEVDWLTNCTPYNEHGFLNPELTTCRHQNVFDTAKPVSLDLDESMFSLRSECGSATTNNKMKRPKYDDLLGDKVLGNFCCEDGTRSFQFGHFTDDQLLGVDSSSAAFPTRGLFCKVPHEFSFNSPSTDIFSDSTFEFQATGLESGILMSAQESPALWERRFDTTHTCSMVSHDKREFDSLFLTKNENMETSLVRNITEEESSSVDTLFGTNRFDLPSSPKSPLFSQSPPLKLNLAGILDDSMDFSIP